MYPSSPHSWFIPARLILLDLIILILLEDFIKQTKMNSNEQTDAT
jgi:hypothetical protein